MTQRSVCRPRPPQFNFLSEDDNKLFNDLLVGINRRRQRLGIGDLSRIEFADMITALYSEDESICSERLRELTERGWSLSLQFNRQKEK